MCGMRFNIVKAHVKEGMELKPEYVDKFIAAVRCAVSKAETKTEGAQRGAITRLHGLCTKSKCMLVEERGVSATEWYKQIDFLQIELRTREQGRLIRPDELVPGSPRNRYS